MMMYALVCHRQWYHVMRLPVAARPGGAFAWTPEAPESAGPWRPSYGHPIRTKSLEAKLGLPFRNSHHCEIRYRLIIYYIIYIYTYISMFECDCIRMHTYIQLYIYMCVCDLIWQYKIYETHVRIIVSIQLNTYLSSPVGPLNDQCYQMCSCHFSSAHVQWCSCRHDISA